MSKSTQGQLHNSWHNFSKYRPLIRELVTRDLKVKYRRSVLGYVWSIPKPAAYDAAADACVLLYVPVRHPELPAVPDLRQYPVQLF